MTQVLSMIIAGTVAVQYLKLEASHTAHARTLRYVSGRRKLTQRTTTCMTSFSDVQRTHKK